MWKATDGWRRLAAACDGSVGVPLREPKTAGDEACILGSMRTEGAAAAADFFAVHRWFLSAFEERGRVDTGYVAAPWFDDVLPSTWQATNASFVSAVGGAPWTTYAKVETATATPGGQRLVISYPLRQCRACGDLGYLRLQVDFDAAGNMVGRTFLAPAPGTATPAPSR